MTLRKTLAKTLARTLGKTLGKIPLSASTLVLLSLVPYVAFADIKRHSAIPEQFWGKWATSADDCRHADKTYIALAAKSYANADMNCSVDWVAETAAARGALYSARLRCAKPGSPPALSNIIFRRSDAETDTDHILAGTSYSNLKAYGRCSAAEPVTAR
jgi:hypothetical protein